MEEQLQDSGPTCLDSIKVMRHKGRSEHEGDMAMNVTYDPGLDPGPEKRMSEGQQAKMRVGDMYRRWRSCINVHFLILIITLWLCKMLMLENLGEGYMTALCSISVPFVKVCNYFKN